MRGVRERREEEEQEERGNRTEALPLPSNTGYTILSSPHPPVP